MSDAVDSRATDGAKRMKHETGDGATHAKSKTLTHNDYTVGWISPLTVELIVALEMLDEEHNKLPQSPADHNVYHLGSIAGRNVVIAGVWQAGNPEAATVVAQMRMTFPNIRFGLLVGIGGGVPVETDEGMIRLGHVVVSKPVGLYSGAIQYDRGKATVGEFVRTGALAPPPPVLLLASQALGAQRARRRHDPLLENVQRIDTSMPGLRHYRYPGADQDFLFPASYVHVSEGVSCDTCDCHPDQRIRRDTSQTTPIITVHRGTIASGEHVLKNGEQRDQLGREYGVLCFEMEAAGALSDFPCLVIRGISDYCDSHKNDKWHGFAAAAAAAYARELFLHMPIDQANRMVSVEDPGFKRIVDRSDNEERQRVAQWISSTNHSAVHAENMNKRTEGTGLWLLETTEFYKWVTKKGVLYCPGIPGAGKTVLASIIINHLQQTYVNQDVGIAYIFCNYREQSEQNVTSILAGILKQLVQGLQIVPDNLLAIYRRRHLGGPRLQQAELFDLLTAVCNICFGRTFIIIDALDECSSFEQPRNDVISHLLGLQEKCNISLLATSRMIPEIAVWFDQFATCEIKAVDSDVKQYAQSRVLEVSNCVRQRPDLAEQIVSEIVQRANGMFLLAKLYMDSLRGIGRAKEIKDALSKFQTGSDAYNDAYKKTMERIEHQTESQANLAKQLLSWLTFARRSLTLTELQQALAVELGESSFDEENLPDIQDMISTCAGLVLYSERNHIVTLVHFTTQEFLEKEGALYFPNAHRDMGHICLTYLCYDAFKSAPPTHFRDYEERRRRHPLYEYCALNWSVHAKLQTPDLQLTLKLLRNAQLVVACAQGLPRADRKKLLRLPENVAGIHMAVMLGLETETKALLNDGRHQIDAQSDSLGTLLFTAIWKGQESIVRLLVERGGDIRQRDEHGQTSLAIAAEVGNVPLLSFLLDLGLRSELSIEESYSLLSCAAGSGNVQAVRLLLDGPRNIEQEDQFNRKSPLAEAVSKGHPAVVRLLLESGARTDTKILVWSYTELKRWKTILCLAAEQGNCETMKLLLERHLDPNRPDSRGRPPLSYAAEKGHLDIIGLLLAAGANIDQTEPWGSGFQTAIWQATSGMKRECLKLLLEKGANPNLFKIRSPLSEAASMGDLQMVKLLLEKGANPNLFEDPSPLSEAASRRDLQMVKLLFEHAADPYLNKEDRLGILKLPALPEDPGNGGFDPKATEVLRVIVKHGTKSSVRFSVEEALIQAAGGGYRELSEVLIDEGADINTRDSQSGETPLSCAATNDRTQTLLVLINKGADCEIRDISGQTALSKAVQRGHESAVELLIENGADVRCRGPFGQSPIFFAIEKRTEKIIHLLLRQDPTLLDTEDDFGRSVLLLATENACEAARRIIGNDPSRSEILTQGVKNVFHIISSPGYELTCGKGETLFFWAASHGYVDVIQFLCARGISHECENDAGRTPFTLAIRHRQLAVVDFLLCQGVCPKLPDRWGHAPLSWALSTGDEVVVRLLLASGADPIAWIKLPHGPSCSPLLWAAKKGYESTVRLLLQMGADPNEFWRLPSSTRIGSQSFPGEIGSVLSSAVESGSYSVTEALLDYGVDSTLCHASLVRAMELDKRPLVPLIMKKGIRNKWLLAEYGQLVLFHAAFAGYVDVVRALLDQGMDANTRPTQYCIVFSDKGGTMIDDTPIYFAVQEGHEKVVQVLLERGADLEFRASLRLAIDNWQFKVVELLLQHGACLNDEKEGLSLRESLQHAIKNGQSKIADLLLQHGACLNINEDGPSLLLSVVRESRYDLVKFLLNNGVSANARDDDAHPLLDAVSAEQASICKLLLERGADPTSTDKIGRNALTLAAQKGHFEMVDLFLQNGICANSTDCLGRTALFFAVVRQNTAIVRLLMKHSADPEARTCSGRTPISVAADYNYIETRQILEGKLGEAQVSTSEVAVVDDQSDWQCNSCGRLIPDIEPFLHCSICEIHDGETCACLECYEGNLGCFDRLHTLKKMVYTDGKRVAVEDVAKWKRITLPIHTGHA